MKKALCLLSLAFLVSCGMKKQENTVHPEVEILKKTEATNNMPPAELKSIREFHEREHDVEELIAFIRSDSPEKSEYDLSQKAIDGFGYMLIGKNNLEEAAEIFLLNTEMYPNEYGTYDSLGECLMLLGRKAEGLAAYRKSLVLNPENENAKAVLERNE